MSCGTCGSTSAPPKRRFRVVLEDGSEHHFLTRTEARMYALANGGGDINQTE